MSTDGGHSPRRAARLLAGNNYAACATWPR
jgi:hypothetical protein